MTSRQELALREAEGALVSISNSLEAERELIHRRLFVLEATASVLGGWDLQEYWSKFEIDSKGLDASKLRDHSVEIIKAIESASVPAPLALTILGREQIDKHQQRKTGAFYTDWKLALDLAKSAVSHVEATGLWVDPACGSGTLLVAAALEGQSLGNDVDDLIKLKLTGIDLSPNALRATRMAVASLTGKLESITSFNSRLLNLDSLVESEEWSRKNLDGVALVIGNPPWEKLKVNRHEFAQNSDGSHIYGQRLERKKERDALIASEREVLREYAATAVSGRKLQGTGETDAYKLFLELGMGLLSHGGVLAMLVPAGLIRSQGTEDLRREIIKVSSKICIDVFDNRQRYFDIDTRFKFVSIVAKNSKAPSKKIDFCVVGREGRTHKNMVSISIPLLKQVSPDLTIPEVGSEKEWKLYQKLSKSGQPMVAAQSNWSATFSREVDMTNDSKYFVPGCGATGVQLIEGRHVSQFRNRSKAYQSGSGRASKWIPVPREDANELVSQWRIDASNLSISANRNLNRSRIGFCDITGQTNERSLLVARIPTGVVCGNKVPTLRFHNDSRDREDLFIAIANSFVVDWVVRRRISTTINFFILESLPLPAIDLNSKEAKELIKLCRTVSESEGAKRSNWQIAKYRAQMDALIAAIYNLSESELFLLLSDFPLLDRGQPPIDDEDKSYITRDLVLHSFCVIGDGNHEFWQNRVKKARKLGATAYVPAEYA